MTSLRPFPVLFLSIVIAAQVSAAPDRKLDPQVAAEHGHPELVASACSHDLRLARQSAELMHHDNVVKFDEHVASLQLVPSCAATHMAIHSGAWTDPQTWRDGKAPGSKARVIIPDAVTVRVDGVIGDLLEWVRVDGRLSFAPDVDTALTVRTLVIAAEGSLTIGSAAEPIGAGVKARLLFAPRLARDRRADPFDLAGGLISHGIVTMVAAQKTSHRSAAMPPSRGMVQVEFADPPQGWQVGDQVLVPGTDVYNVEDEVRTISNIRMDGRTIELDHPLSFDHLAPWGLSIPIGNLTRNIQVRSLETGAAVGRGHVMIMHVQTGSVFDGVAFLHLGRTDTHRAHTFPAVGPDGRTTPGTDANTIGRYAVHFHMRSGARADLPPHVVRNSVVMNSPKFGIVNHGGHLLAEDNVTFQVAGSHFVAENGSEIGAFRRNMAVRSAGSGEQILESRMSIYDFAHGGHGFWLQSGGVEVTDNWASGHAGAGIFSMGMDFRENGEVVYFDGKNVAPSPYADELGRIPIMDVNFYLGHNTVTASGKGLEVWYHKVYTQNFSQFGVVDGLNVWNVLEEAVALPYSKSVALRNLRLLGSKMHAFAAIDGNKLTENITIDGADIRDFAVGMRLPPRGQNVIRNVSLKNVVNLEIPLPVHEGRQIHLDNLNFIADESGQAIDIAMKASEALYGDLALLFEPDRINLTDRHGRNRRLFFPFQHPETVLFPAEGPERIRGLTVAEIYKQFGLAPGGALAPANSIMLPKSNALAAASERNSNVDPDLPRIASLGPPISDGSVDRSKGFEAFPIRWKHFLGQLDGDSAKGWNFVPSTGAAERALVYVNPNPPKFMLRRGLLPLRIHPEDVRYGYRVHGVVLEPVDGRLTMRNWEREFRNLTVEPDGYVRITFSITNLAGVETPVTIALEVTPEAVRRGTNVDYYIQREFCGACGSETLQEDAKRFYEAEEAEPLDQLEGVCQRAKERIELRKPFAREAGFAYLAAVPELVEAADGANAGHRSPFFLCEGRTALTGPHSLHDNIRRYGRGQYSHWSQQLYFSSSDGSDPNTNGREYLLVRRP
jgi:G8 domain